MTGGPLMPTCAYCGAELEPGEPCSTCLGLPEIERELRHDHRPLTEHELGMPPRRPIGDREGRRELY